MFDLIFFLIRKIELSFEVSITYLVPFPEYSVRNR